MLKNTNSFVSWCSFDTRGIEISNSVEHQLPISEFKAYNKIKSIV
jgi:hypothetical protein